MYQALQVPCPLLIVRPKTLVNCIALIIYVSICRTELLFDPTTLLKISSIRARKQIAKARHPLSAVSAQ